MALKVLIVWVVSRESVCLRYDLRLFSFHPLKNLKVKTEEKVIFHLSFEMCVLICTLEAQAWLLSPRQTNNRLTWCQYFDLSINGK